MEEKGRLFGDRSERVLWHKHDNSTPIFGRFGINSYSTGLKSIHLSHLTFDSLQPSAFRLQPSAFSL